MKSLESKIRPSSWASCTQLCIVNDFRCKTPMGPRGAAAGEACGATGNLGIVGIVLGFNPGSPVETPHSRASVPHL